MRKEKLCTTVTLFGLAFGAQEKPRFMIEKKRKNTGHREAKKKIIFINNTMRTQCSEQCVQLVSLQWIKFFLQPLSHFLLLHFFLSSSKSETSKRTYNTQ
jgi:DNA relaxase NicK